MNRKVDLDELRAAQLVAPVSVKLGALQHERDFDQAAAWLEHWTTLIEERSKVNFLVMLKGRRDNNNDYKAGQAFATLATQWIDERYLNG